MKKGVIVVVVIGIAAALGFFLQRKTRDEVAVVPVAATTAAAAPTPAEPTPETEAVKPAVIPDNLPDFTLVDRDNKKRSLSEWKGHPLMVNFWATWCGPCRREIPLLNKLRTEHKAMKLEIIGVAVDFRDDVLKYIKENPISYPVLIGEEDGLAAVKAMGVDNAAFPFTVFADSKRRILALRLGELFPEDAEMILDRLARVDAGTLQLPEARQQITAALKESATRRATSKAAKG